MLAILGRQLSMVAVTLACAQQAGAQVFVSAPGNIPQGNPFNNSWTEQVDFADIDLDGDLDCALADGGDCCNDQNRLWVNQGGAQGGTLGFFVDVTAVQAPAVTDMSRDIEFVDFDGDGDPDVHVANISDVFPQAGRWWTNQGGLQSGVAGFFVDETALRWSGLGSVGSSVPASVVLPSGGYISSAQDHEFADVDDDGDMDLVAAAVGNAFGGLEPTRVFLNDGLGVFSEFNPSGFQLGGSYISTGNPALWCEGNQQSNTTDTTGAFADIAVAAAAVSLGDVDGDLDLDVLLGDRHTTPRMFRNRLEETGGLAFRDVTGLTWPQGWGAGTGKYEQDLADLDGDLDLDLICLNWLAPYDDLTLRGAGDGTFAEPTGIAGTGGDDDGCDPIDYDSDGDLDVYVCAFQGAEKLLTNHFAGGSLSFANVPGAVVGLTGTTGHNVGVADVDQDGDFDVLRVGEHANALLINVLDVPDTTAPRLAKLEQPADHANGGTTPIRVQAHDNVPDALLDGGTHELLHSVDGAPFVGAPMGWSGGQVLRGELPASAVGNVRYFVRSTDEHGNVGESDLKSIDTAGGCSGQAATYCTPKLNSDGCLPRMEFEGAPKVGGLTSFVIRGTDVLANANGLLIYSKAGPNNAPFNGGVLCVGAGLLRTPGQNSGGAGPCGGTLVFDFNSWVALGSDPALVAGQKVWAQFWYRDVASPGGNGLTNGVTFTLCP
jgi:hypothetical protein